MGYYRDFTKREDKLSTVEVAEVRHGHWIRHDDELLGLTEECSECHCEGMVHGNYCPNCGAKMDEASDEMKVICISGKARHGKDTVANIIKDIAEYNKKRVEIMHYGDLVKYVCKTFFDWNGEKDEKGRTLLQHVGTDIIRNERPEYWVEFIADMIEFFRDEWDCVIIPDCRFPNEVERLRERGMNPIHLSVVRKNFDNGLTEEQKSHQSEVAMDNVEPDYIIDNDGDLIDLVNKVKECCKNVLLMEETIK